MDYIYASKYPIITLCGSTKFKNEFISAYESLSLKGNIVLSVCMFGHADNKFDSIITAEVKDLFDNMHREKIKISNSIYVINKDDYIGESTRKEIEYAKSLNKKIEYMFPHNEN